MAANTIRKFGNAHASSPYSTTHNRSGLRARTSRASPGDRDFRPKLAKHSAADGKRSATPMFRIELHSKNDMLLECAATVCVAGDVPGTDPYVQKRYGALPPADLNQQIIRLNRTYGVARHIYPGDRTSPGEISFEQIQYDINAIRQLIRIKGGLSN
jgi:hypothetical protein